MSWEEAEKWLELGEGGRRKRAAAGSWVEARRLNQSEQQGAGSSDNDDAKTTMEGDSPETKPRPEAGSPGASRGFQAGTRVCYKHVFSSRIREREEVAR